MKKYTIITIIAFLAILVSACEKADNSSNKLEDTKNNLSRVETEVPDGLSLFAIPDSLETPSDYNGDFTVYQEEFEITYEGEDYTAVIYWELDENGDINTIAFSTDVANAFGLEEDFILTEEGFEEQLAVAHALGSPDGFWDRLKKFFIGEPCSTPCFMGKQNKCYCHWLVGTYGCEEVDC